MTAPFLLRRSRKHEEENTMSSKLKRKDPNALPLKLLETEPDHSLYTWGKYRVTDMRVDKQRSLTIFVDRGQKSPSQAQMKGLLQRLAMIPEGYTSEPCPIDGGWVHYFVCSDETATAKAPVFSQEMVNRYNEGGVFSEEDRARMREEFYRSR